MPTKYNLNDHYKGDTFEELQFTILNTNGLTPIDLTGVLIESKFRKSSKVGFVQKTISTTTGGITIVDAINGIFRIDSFILDWNSATYYYDIQFTFTDGSVITYIEGTIKIIQDVTYG